MASWVLVHLLIGFRVVLRQDSARLEYISARGMKSSEWLGNILALRALFLVF